VRAHALTRMRTTPAPQVQVHLLVPPDPQLYNFWVTMVLAIVGQSVGVLWMLYRQVK
jgi:meckelin